MGPQADSHSCPQDAGKTGGDGEDDGRTGSKGSKGRKGFTERRISGGGPGGGGSKCPRTTSGEVACSFEEIGLGAGGLGGGGSKRPRMTSSVQFGGDWVGGGRIK
ncbi:hypothetical protein DEU56DRAFT_759940 [Suillus clintonianus]|uniref:uncharacterized protein n=1 Tax=Suillus clintonianus TaxID=1904413 RepID=UPI001B8758C2|nr:uncharacterized protein DEU56DRAFT_759940 [Suillus clintonianus]KAG2123727.1 hypothetical protein DEU56DRAFT_759940 [Suillus clintonianus]